HGTRAYLARAKGIRVVGATGMGMKALRLVEKHRPDVLILDLHLPDISGVDVARQVHDHHPDVALLVFTGYEDPGYLHRLHEVGIKGYLRKTAPSEELVGAVRAVAADQT